MLNLAHQYNKDNKTVIYNIIKEGRMIIAEFAIFPTSKGISLSRYVREVIRIIEKSSLKSITGGMATTIEAPDIKTLFDVIEKTHKVLVGMGVTDKKDEYITLTAHYDGRRMDGNLVLNGANDNTTGVAAIRDSPSQFFTNAELSQLS